MRRALGFVAATIAACLCAAATANAAPGDFYLNLLHRGAAYVNAGNNEAAIKPLRVAAFGLVESLPDFETAQAYLVVANARLKRETEARTALQRLLVAERIEHHYAALPLSAEVRGEVERAARALLTAEQVATLLASGTAGGTGGDGGTQPEVKPPTIVKPPIATPPPPPKPVVPPPAPPPQQPATSNQQPSPQPSPPKAGETPALLLQHGDVAGARAGYIALLDSPTLDHAAAIDAGQALYRMGAFRDAVRAFERAGTFAANEQALRYYYAVALYESGKYGAAKRELAAALPHVEITPDVARYRAKIEGAIE